MPASSEVQTIIENAVAEVLERVLPTLRAQIARQASDALQSLIAAPGNSTSEIFDEAATAIQRAGTQADILRQLLEGQSRFAARLALFVVKGNSASGWQAFGFDDNDIRKFTVGTAAGLAGKAFQDRIPVCGGAVEFDPAFVSAMASPRDAKCIVLPLVVKDKVAALIYADAGQSGTIDHPALSALTRFAAIWLELTALRKVSPAVMEEPQPVAAMAAAAAPAPIPASIPTLVSDDSELHKKAKRFAKLLVEEIKLYNQPKVNEGRQNGDLYERLKEDIEKSRATYDKRYGDGPVGSAGYFNQELIRILAENDISLMGNGFPR